MATVSDYQTRVSGHYTPANLDDAIFDGLRRSGKDPAHISHDDLAPLDQFHSRGKLATMELAHAAELRPGMHVLDVGGGLGGPARTLAAEFGCRVTVLDITDAYCRIGAMLTERTGQSGQVRFHRGSALDMPFAAESFDVAWTQHSSMNIEDKERLYREVRCMLRPQGRLATYEIVAGPVQPIYSPVPWAAESDLSFLRPAAAVRSLIENTGFKEVHFADKSQLALTWFRERMVSPPSTPPPLGLHLLLGKNFKPAFQNVVKNLEENRVAVIEAVYRLE